MKRFLRTYAIFACIALLFSACNAEAETDESTYDGDPIVGSPDITGVSPGNSKFEVEWMVPSSEYVVGSKLSWNDGTNYYEEYVYDISPRETVSRTIDAEVATYTVTVENICEVDVYTISSSMTVTVFNDATYSTSTAITPTEVVHSGTSASLYWGEIPDDCAGIVATYSRSGVEFTSTLLSVATGVTVLSGADANTDYTYETCYQPDGAMSDEYITKSNSGTLPYSSPSAPSALTVKPGDGKMQIFWTMLSSSTYLNKTIITYWSTDGGSSGTVEVSKADMDLGTTNKILIENLTKSKTYYVSVCNSDEEEDSKSLSLTSTAIEVYDYDNLSSTYTSSLPTLSVTSDSSGNVYFEVIKSTMVGAATCDYVTLNYQYNSRNPDPENDRAYKIITDFTTPTTISNAVQGSVYYYTATFELPDNSLDSDITVTGPSGYIPYATTE